MNQITTSLSAFLVGFLSLTGDVSAELLDLHLPVVPRTEAEVERIKRVTTPTTNFEKAEQFEGNPAGAATVRVRKTSNAFSSASGNISFERELDFKVGNGLFKKLWVSSPSSTLASDGLGPIFNARSCQRCHLKDGRGHPPEGPDDTATSMLVRISIPGGPTPEEIKDYIATQPDPTYGGQIQDFSVAGIKAEAEPRVTYTEKTIALSGGKRHPCAYQTIR